LAHGRNDDAIGQIEGASWRWKLVLGKKKTHKNDFKFGFANADAMRILAIKC
jgi:hypothetical protein